MQVSICLSPVSPIRLHHSPSHTKTIGIHATDSQKVPRQRDKGITVVAAEERCSACHNKLCTSMPHCLCESSVRFSRPDPFELMHGRGCLLIAIFPTAHGLTKGVDRSHYYSRPNPTFWQGTAGRHLEAAVALRTLYVNSLALRMYTG